MAGAIAETARHALSSEFRHVDTRRSRAFLVEAGPRILAQFPEDLAADAQCRLAGMGVEVLSGERVTDCDDNGVTTNQRHIDAGAIVWAAGVKASPAAVWLGV